MPELAPDYLLEMNDLKLHFFTNEGVVKAVNGVSYAIRRGKTLCVVGESGCGKSVAARAILQIVHRPGKIINGTILYHKPMADGGTRTIDITALHPRGAAIRDIRGNDIAMIFQEPMTSLSPLYTVGNQIIEAIRLHSPVSKQEARQRAIEMLEKVGIPKPEIRIDEYPFRLSGGMRQRCMIAMALSCKPKLLIADEPTTALDVTIQAQILDLLLRLQRERGMSLLLITHDLGVVANTADDVAIMYAGEIVAAATVRRLFESPLHPYTLGLFEAIPRIGKRVRRLATIPGAVPAFTEPPVGCAFHPRCFKAADECLRGPIPLLSRKGHSVRCIRA